MAKYVMTTEIEAEQFLPKEDKIPKGATGDGPRSPKADPRSAWIIITEEGMTYLTDGDYVITSATGSRYVMNKESFENNYKPVEG